MTIFTHPYKLVSWTSTFPQPPLSYLLCPMFTILVHCFLLNSQPVVWLPKDQSTVTILKIISDFLISKLSDLLLVNIPKSLHQHLSLLSSINIILSQVL